MVVSVWVLIEHPFSIHPESKIPRFLHYNRTDAHSESRRFFACKPFIIGEKHEKRINHH